MLFSIVVFLTGMALVATVAIAMISFSSALEKQQTDAVKQSVEKAVVHCYSLEGRYPPDLTYLQKNYGLILDDSHYVYKYSCFASNLAPTIFIFKK